MEIQYFIKFQFHYGSIKISRKPSSRRNYSRFNSTMVRLKSFSCAPKNAMENVFQFHYGSIKILTSKCLLRI